MKSAARLRERGLSLLEIAVSMAVLASASMGVAGSMMTGMAANRRYQLDTIVMARAQHHLETMYNLQFGVTGDAAASAAKIDTVFSGDPELGTDPPSLTALARAFDAMPNDTYAFTPANLGIDGQFQVRISNNVTKTLKYSASLDADNDGVPDDGCATLVEGATVKQFANLGCYEADDGDLSRELFCIEIAFKPSTPANAPARLLFRGFRAQDP